MSEWQPIEKANKEPFTVVLLCRNGQRTSMPCYWNEEKWMCATIFGQGMEYVNPTHWQPLPEPPEK